MSNAAHFSTALGISEEPTILDLVCVRLAMTKYKLNVIINPK